MHDLRHGVHLVLTNLIFGCFSLTLRGITFHSSRYRSERTVGLKKGAEELK